MRKAIKIITVIILGLVTIAAALFATYAIITKDAVLDAGKLVGAGQNVSILDEDGNEIASTGLGAQKKSVAVRNLNKDTVNAFIASEAQLQTYAQSAVQKPDIAFVQRRRVDHKPAAYQEHAPFERQNNQA